ncbi:hypothetical protein HanRHA438_Chr08g0337661 [Helianthus annuus]|nr:hypothetical protein HanRHA438_Chr08g0337661 [Helianthus annuus]
MLWLLMMIDDGGDGGDCVAAVCGGGRRGQWRWFNHVRLLSLFLNYFYELQNFFTRKNLIRVIVQIRIVDKQ